ncbi:MAG: G1 family glutamic endopeptidase [Solirubrobacteraceae bacterium]
MAAAILMTLALVLAGAPAALADATRSSNWAGYALHRSGMSFTRVMGAWRQPSATCTPHIPTYSSVWVGLGGYRVGSRALEQIGSEVDCNAAGKIESSAWYELVPAGSRKIKITVRPGDELSASVSVSGHRVRLALRDRTRRSSFTRTLRATTADVSSAEWILEAPSVCAGGYSCRTLALAAFGSASFSRASAVTTTGEEGSIADRRWGATRISLAPSGRHFIERSASGIGASALPSSLSARGSSFTVTYRGTPSTTTPSLARPQARAATASLVR